MKRLLLIVFLLIPPAAFATPVDSILGPFHYPLQLGVVVHGSFISDVCAMPADPPPGDSFGFTFNVVIDTSVYDSAWQHGDTVSFKFDSIVNYRGNVSVSQRGVDIVFDSIKKIIGTVRLWSFTSFNPQPPPYPQITEDWEVILSHFSYDSNSIFSNDSLLASHLVACYYGYTQQNSGFNSDSKCSRLDTVSSIELTGMFRPTHLLYSSVALPNQTAPAEISIQVTNGFIECCFPTFDHWRSLELYTPLGSKAASFEIPPGQSKIALPNLPSGLYFVRMEGVVLKVAVP